MYIEQINTTDAFIHSIDISLINHRVHRVCLSVWRIKLKNPSAACSWNRTQLRNRFSKSKSSSFWCMWVHLCSSGHNWFMRLSKHAHMVGINFVHVIADGRFVSNFVFFFVQKLGKYRGNGISTISGKAECIGYWISRTMEPCAPIIYCYQCPIVILMALYCVWKRIYGYCGLCAHKWICKCISVGLSEKIHSKKLDEKRLSQ